MKMKTNKLLTLTLATGLVAMTAGCGASKTPAATGGGDNTPTPPVTTPDVAYSAWSGGVTTAADATENAFLAGTAAVAGVGGAAGTAANLTGLSTGTNATILTLASEVTPDGFTPATPANAKAINAVNLGGAATNAVGFAATATDASARYVAGLIAGADLGQPLTTTTASGTWAGLFQAVGDAAHTTRKAFTLTVTFGSTAGNTITALVPANDNANAHAVAGDTSYYISGTYDAAGVITGNVLYADFATANTEANVLENAGAAFTAATAATGANSFGTLSGLIGENGVLGAFYSTGPDGNGATGFAGGFVASKNPNVGGDDPDAVYADWSGSDDVTLVTTLEDNGFLASITTDADGLDVPASTSTPSATIAPMFTTLNLNSPTHAQVDAQPGVAGTGPRTLGGAATSGVAFFSNPGAAAATDARYFAGLHFGTDLGAPITTVLGSAEWRGLIQTISGTVAAQFDAKLFTLSVNYVDSEISAHVTTDTADTNFGIASYYLTGEYDDAGVITGTVSYSIIANTPEARTAATGNGTLSGLISATRAVGAFHSTAGGAAGYAGGFVARSTAIPAGTPIAALPVVNYADWTLTAATALTANGFLLAGTTGDTLTLAPSSGTTIEKLDLASGTAGGVSFFTTGSTGAEFYHAGLHFDTNLGAPVLATTTDATWEGTFQAVGATGADTITSSKTIMLAIGFGTAPTDRTIQGSVATGLSSVALAASIPVYHINATYTEAGLISGNILYQATGEATSTGIASAGADLSAVAGGGTVTGLIGQSGLVGAFHSSNSVDGTTGALGYAGGFVAAPPATP